MVKTDVMGFDDLTGCQHTYAEALNDFDCHYHEMAIEVDELERILTP